MPSSRKTAAKNTATDDPLFFRYLPGYAAFLLANKLEDYVRDQVAFSREEKVPLLKYFDHLSDPELVELGKGSGAELLTVLAENKVKEYLAKATADYVKNRIPSIEREQVAARDITSISFVRRKTFQKLLPFYTQDFALFAGIMEEVDRFVSESEAMSFGAYIEVQQEKISRINTELTQRYDELLEAQELADMGSFLWSLQGGKSSFTPGVMKIFEMEETSNLEAFMEHVHEEDREKLRKAIDTAISGNGIYDCEYRYKKNVEEKRIWSKGQMYFENGKPAYMKGTIMDVTHKYTMLKQLQESEAQNKQAQAITHIGNWAWEIATNKITWSDEMYRIYGLEPQSEEISFDRFVSLIHADDREKRMTEIRESLDSRQARDYLMRVVNPDGKVKILRGKGEVVTDKNNNPVKLVGTCQDITKEHKLTVELQQKSGQLEKLNASLAFKNTELERINKELESFNYVASHDLQEPLRKIQTFTNRILEKGKDSLPPASADYFGKIITSSARMQTLIEDLLTFSQTTANENNFELADLNTILEEVKSILSQAIEDKKVVIESATLPVAKVIPFQFQQLLLNLVSNAIKYSKEHVAPYIRISSTMIGGNKISSSMAISDRHYIELKVEDNGIGFDEEHAEKIFGLFQRLHNKDKYSGTGIGLAICKKIAHNHEGFIIATSTLSAGSVFSVYIPAGHTETHPGTLVN